jgi:hypothetical protein
MIHRREFFTGYADRCVATPETLAMSGDVVGHVLMLGGVPYPFDWRWPAASRWSLGHSCDLLYIARGPARTIKIGRSGKPMRRVEQLNEPSQARRVAARIGDAGAHRLVLVVSKGCGPRERALLRIVQAERVSGEWSRGPVSEFLLATLAQSAEAWGADRKAA